MADADTLQVSTEQLKFRLHLKKLEIWDSAVRLAIPWGFGGLIALCGAYAISVLAGKYTFAQIGISFLGNFSVSETISYTVGIAGAVYGFRQRALRRKNIERMSSQIRTLEKERYPNRSSSDLTEHGTTQPGDR